MCTAISFLNQHHYFGRTLDYELSYGEGIAVTPRAYPLRFQNGETLCEHYAMIGMATVVDDYPLYFDAANEKGLSVAGLLFSGNAVYQPRKADGCGVASFEWIPWLLGRCASVSEVCAALRDVYITDEAFSDRLPPSPLHWLIADAERAVVVEPLAEGLRVYDNPFGVLTNNPPFEYHRLHVAEFLSSTDQPPRNHLCSNVSVQPYSRGMGGLGLPGDWSSASRFIRVLFAKSHAVCGGTREEEISQFFHIMRTVEVPRGVVTLEGGERVITQYTSCCDTESGTYYCTTYHNSTIFMVNMYTKDLTGDGILWYSLPD